MVLGLLPLWYATTWWLGLWWRTIHKAVAGITNDTGINIPVPRPITLDAITNKRRSGKP